MKRPLCLCGCKRPARKGLHFASQKCASEWVEELLLGDELKWCPDCEKWQAPDYTFANRLICGHTG